MHRLIKTLVLSLCALSSSAQVSFTANNHSTPYESGFHPSANMGAYGAFSDETLAELAAGNPEKGVPGVGVKALRTGLFEKFVEAWGYDSRIEAFEFYQSLGMGEHTVIVGFPSEAHRDPAYYCPGVQSELFANLYTPVWDGGANGTPYNDENYYAAYLYKTVDLYKDYVRFWEIWNEPGFDYTGGTGFQEPGSPGNWWDNNPDPCDYKLRAPIFHYVRLLRISWEIIKTLDPDAYVVVSGTGYPSFLDAILRNTDNPVDGSVTPDYPLGGGAYFDVMGYHAYPHFDGSLREWSDSLNGWQYFRHSDGAAEGVLNTKNSYQELLSEYGYNGSTYPLKKWIITEVNLPRKAFPDPSDPGENFIGSTEAQRNFMIKAMTLCMANDILQMQIYKLAEDTYFENAHTEFDLMGLYKRLNYNNLYFQLLNDEGIAHKTASALLSGKAYNAARTAQLNLNGNTGGAAFQDIDGNFTYVLWAKTLTDQSETASVNFTFPPLMNVQHLLKWEWNASETHIAVPAAPDNIPLTGSPVFLTERIFTMNAYTGCVPFNLQLAGLVTGATQWNWTILQPDNGTVHLTGQNPAALLTLPGEYQVTLEAYNAAGQLIGKQSQVLRTGTTPIPQFDVTVSGPVVHFQNHTANGLHDFLWSFGDGNFSTEAVPAHVYLQSGIYTVSLSVTTPCGTENTVKTVNVTAPSPTQPLFTANDTVPAFTGYFRPGVSRDFIPGWTEAQIADIAAGNPVKNVQGAGIKSLRTFTGESYFLENGYEAAQDLFQYYQNLGLSDQTFMLAFPGEENRDSFLYCPDHPSNLFKDLYLDIWDGGANGTPVNEKNPFALYVWNTVNQYRDYVKFWEIYNAPDYDLTGERGWLPAGQPGNWWESNPDPCDYALGAPIFYYIRSLRIAYEIIHTVDPEAYVTLSGLAYPSFLDAVCRNTDNPLDGSPAASYPLKGGAYFDAVGFKSYPHFDGSTIYFDVNAGAFAYRRHSDAAVEGIRRIQQQFSEVLKNYGYDAGGNFPEKEWTISEANLPGKQLGQYIGSAEAQRNWIIKAWVESVKNGIRQLNFFRLSESHAFSEAQDPFQVMGIYKTLSGVSPFNQTLNEEGIALKTCSDLLFGTAYHADKTAAMNLPDEISGGAFQDINGHFIYVLWAKTTADQSEAAAATYTFPGVFNLGQLKKYTWDFSVNPQASFVSPVSIPLTGTPVFLTTSVEVTMPPVAFFQASQTQLCEGGATQFTSLASGNPDTWEWTFEGGQPSHFEGETPPAIFYQNPGTYSVGLMVNNAAGTHEAFYEEMISVQAGPEAAFEVVIDGASVQFINFSNPGPGTPGTSYEWCYGDGFCNNAASPAYTYFENGNYTVTLTASNQCGSASYEESILIAAAPTANFIHNFWGNCGELLTQFVDQSFSGPDYWEWHFSGAVPENSSQQFPVVTFLEAGWQEITLIAGNNFGADTLIRQVYIEGPVTQELNLSMCPGAAFHGIPVYQDTVITLLLPTYHLGCDSTVVASIIVSTQLETFHDVMICEGAEFHGTAIYSDTTIVEYVALSQGCDSVATTVITVFPDQEMHLSATLAAGEYFTVGNQFFTQTGIYEIPLHTWRGCDSLVVLDLTVLTGTEEHAAEKTGLKAYPNPFSNKVHFTLTLSNPETVSLEIVDVNGRLVSQLIKNRDFDSGEHQVDWESVPEILGVYWVRLITTVQQFYFKLIKTEE